MDKEKLIEHIKGYMQITLDDSNKAGDLLDIRYCSGKLMACKIIITAIESGKFDKEPCDQCAKWSQTIHLFCPNCGRKLGE